MDDFEVAVLAEQIEQILEELRPCPCPCRCPEHNWLQEELEQRRRALAVEFGLRLGLRLSDASFTTEQLARGTGGLIRATDRGFSHPAIDHPSYYRDRQRPAAIAAQLYGEVTDLPQGLTTVRVTDFPSWYIPGMTSLWLVRGGHLRSHGGHSILRSQSTALH